MVRLAIIDVDTTQIDNYKLFLKEEIDASIKKEPGVITLYAVSENENPERIPLSRPTQTRHNISPIFQHFIFKKV
ncbi:MAG TPA: hypothetical protein VFW11_11900 [Cyclobacteriaceae bacterium]|nr:hypothetical protein [Cyclobacteriaceae bacterium]